MPPEATIDFHARQAGFRGCAYDELRLVTNLPDKKLEAAVSALLSRRDLILVDRERRLYVHAETYAYLRQRVLDQLAAYHAKHPLKAGMPREELRSKFPPGISPKLAPQVLNQMIKADELAAESDTIRLAGHQVSLAVDQNQLKQKIQQAYARGGITPPYFKEVCQTLEIAPRNARDVLQLLVEDNQLVKVKEDLYFQREAIDDLKTRLVAFLREKGAITTPEFKDMTGASRKYVIPLAEYFDAINVTIRVGDTRQLRKG
jgi:selenocysteine-specific elongation factor